METKGGDGMSDEYILPFDCPSCGESVEGILQSNASGGDTTVECPECHTLWRVEMQLYEVTE